MIENEKKKKQKKTERRETRTHDLNIDRVSKVAKIRNRYNQVRSNQMAKRDSNGYMIRKY